MKLKNLILGALLMTVTGAYAHDFSVTIDGQRLYFDITNKVTKTAAVTYKGRIADKNQPEVSGTIEIPSKVNHDNVVYQVTSIGPKAFANANRLTGIIIPTGVESIGDFVFENCDSLKSIIFPSNQVHFGQGTFFKCTKISDVTIGSDWKSIDFTMFRWSDSITSVMIPAKVEKIQGIKKLSALTRIYVDPNNKKFSSADGMLYNKDGSILYTCPRALKGKVSVKEGTRTVLPGALMDCVEITYIDLPSTLESISFRETRSMSGLETILLRGDTPIMTGYTEGKGKFFFQIANPMVNIVVKASAKDLYQSAMATAAGMYSASPDGELFMVPLEELPTKKNLKGVKDLEKY